MDSRERDVFHDRRDDDIFGVAHRVNVDLDRFFDPAPKPAATGWLTGWWSVTDGNQYYYWFSPSGVVQYVNAKPMLMYAPPKAPSNSGKFSYLPDGKIFIRWNPADGGTTEETFTPDEAQQTIGGWSNRYAALKAKRM